jgi:unsaturated rhamnogalacturonyl hydrolase
MSLKINRRTFCGQSLSAACIAPFFTAFTDHTSKKPAFTYHPILFQDPSAPKLPVPEGHRVAFGLDYFSLPTTGELALRGPQIPKGFKGEVLFRLQVAIDTREMDEVEVLLARSRKKIGHLSIWYPTGLQLFETALDCNPQTLAEEGIILRMVNGKVPMFFLSSTATNGSHFLLAPVGKAQPTWHQALCSERSIQPFSWLEGSRLDGLHELYVRKKDQVAYQALQSHLAHYLVDDRNLIYVDLWARPRDNSFNNLETGNTFALIAKYRPSHPSIDLYLNYCYKRFDSDMNLIPDHLTQEGLYTLAYPLAVLGNTRKDPKLLEMSIREAEERIQHLTTPDSIFRMGSRTKGCQEIDRNWSRGVVWFLLGLVRTAEQLADSSLKDDPRVARLIEVYQKNAKIVLGYQQKDHSWKSFMHLEETFYETSGTAGLAAALAIGHRLGWLPAFTKARLAKVDERLAKSLTPDGFLKDTTQHNAGSYKLMQMGEYRVISQYTMGFLGIMKAHL